MFWLAERCRYNNWPRADVAGINALGFTANWCVINDRFSANNFEKAIKGTSMNIYWYVAGLTRIEIIVSLDNDGIMRLDSLE